jgi:hypothetical protein
VAVVFNPELAEPSLALMVVGAGEMPGDVVRGASEYVIVPLKGNALDAVDPTGGILVGGMLTVPFCAGVAEEPGDAVAVELGTAVAEVALGTIGDDDDLVEGRADDVKRGVGAPYLGAEFPYP